MIPPRRLGGAATCAALSLLACEGAPPAVAPASRPAPAAAAPREPLPPVASAPATSTAPPATPAPPPPPPVAGDLPREIKLPPLPFTSMASGACKAEVAPPGLIDRFAEGAPVAVWDQVLAQGGCVAFPKDEGLDVSVVLIEGTANVDGGDGPGSLDGPWWAVRAPGGGVTVRARKGDARAVVVVSTTNGAPIACAGGRPCRGTTTPASPWTARKAPVAVFDFTSRRDLAWGGGAFHARIGWEAATTGAPARGHVVDTLLFAPGGGVAEHAHDKEWECIVALEGTGELVRRVEGDAVMRSAVAPGSLVCIPAGQRHAFRGGASRFVAIQIYAPPGPERRFVTLAGG